MKNTLIWAAMLGASGIVLGAMGAHALKQILSEAQLQSFETGVRYQLYHALFLFGIGIMQKIMPQLKLNLVKNFVLLGVFFFSASIYLLSLQDVLGLKMSFLGPVTPIGGLFLISAWVVFAIQVSKSHVN